MEVNYHALDVNTDFSYHDKRRAHFQQLYADFLVNEPGLRGKVLDIGCGHGTNPTLERIKHLLGHVDGVDPFPVVQPHPLIQERWTCALEDLPVPAASYDMAYSYNVIEHVDNPNVFLRKAVELIKPGSCYWSMSPNTWHPFSIAVRALQAVNLKNAYRNTIAPQANDYPAHYKLCSAARVLRAIKQEQLNVAKIDFYYIHCVQWDSFFPASLRFVPHSIDSTLILRTQSLANIFMFRIQKGQ
jgi:2-polyprenyl-3-methyl-5-hydroxy-6-metoxy-1,4-benzoquinol methylase